MITQFQKFFPQLKRRTAYSKAKSGKFYNYRRFREKFQHEIAEDCQFRCVYCDTHENDLGGREAMEIDHFRPYSNKKFSHLKNDPLNFHHSCRKCNLLKSDLWPSSDPNTPHDSHVGFIDPFVEDRRNYFKITANGELIPTQHPAAYLINLLALNRKYLRQIRIRRLYINQLLELIKSNEKKWEKIASGEDLASAQLLATQILAVTAIVDRIITLNN